MSVDAYSSCTCGSGKKFKWCCQPYEAQFKRALEMQRNGQTETALAMLKELTQAHPQTAEIWGRYAEQLWYCEQAEEAERALAKALELNARLPLGFFLRGMFKHERGDFKGALRDYRHAAEICHPDAKQLLTEIYLSITQCEILLMHYLAGRASLDIISRLQPGHEAAMKVLNQVYGVESSLPEILRRHHGFKALTQLADKAVQLQREQALEACRTGKLSDALYAFEELAYANSQDPAILYNLALVRAWLGDQSGAVSALDHYLAHESNEEQAIAASELAIALTLSEDVVNLCDLTHLSIQYRLVDLQQFLAQLQNCKRFIEVKQYQSMIEAKWLDRDLPTAHENMGLYELPLVAAYITIHSQVMIVDGDDPELLQKACRQIEDYFGPAIQASGQPRTVIPDMARIVMDRFKIRFPQGMPPEDSKRLIDAHLNQEFEDRWLQKPLHFLSGRSPMEAAAVSGLRWRAIGFLRFMQHICTGKLPVAYDFNRLEQKLRDVPIDAAQQPPALPELTFAVFKPLAPIAEQSVDELASLPLERLSPDQLKLAMQTAIRLQAIPVAARFAKALLDHSKGDTFAIYQVLVQAALADKQTEQAIQYLEKGMQADKTSNQERRRFDYELLRARVFASCQQARKAYETYVQLLHNHPGNLDLLGTATETMLKAGMRPQALQFAENGILQARAKGDRDRLAYFQELLAVAKRS